MGTTATITFEGDIRRYHLDLVISVAEPVKSYQALCEARELSRELLAMAQGHFGQALREQNQLQADQARAQAHRCEILCQATVDNE